MSSNEFLERLRKVLDEMREEGLDLLTEAPVQASGILSTTCKLRRAFPELRDAGQEASDE